MMGDPNQLSDFIRLKNESGTSDDVYYSTFLEYLPREFQTIAEKELNETDESKMEGLQRLREVLKREKVPDLEDHILTAVLRTCKYDIKKSETRLKRFLKARKLILEKITELDLKKVELIVEDKGIGILPFRDKHGRTIIFSRPKAINADLYSMEDVFLTTVACSIGLLKYPLASVGGWAYIGECKYKSVSSYLAFLKVYQQYMWTFLDLPLRIGRVELIYEQLVTKWFVSVIRPFVNVKILNRLTFFGSNLDKLQKEYHPDILPEEFGGRMGPLNTSLYKDRALDMVRQLQAGARALKEATQQNNA